jgi:serine/threonine-protein kinase PRP4
MTNTPSGSAKRPHPDSDHPKRARDDRDWRDTHLRSPRPDSDRQRSSRGIESGRSSRNSDRWRGDYRRDRSRDRRRDPRRDRDEQPDRRSPTVRIPHEASSTPVPKVESDKEEGE